MTTDRLIQLFDLLDCARRREKMYRQHANACSDVSHSLRKHYINNVDTIIKAKVRIRKAISKEAQAIAEHYGK